MGTINYHTSDYITLGVKPYVYDEFINDPECMEEMQERAEQYNTSIEVEIYDLIDSYYHDDYDNISNLLDNYCFYYYHVVIKSGYYEGFTIDIENNFSIAYDNCTDKREAQKEITQIKQFLIDCAGFGLVACYPSWCTSYKDHNGTIKAINKAVQEMREEVKHIPTWKQYERNITA